MGHTIENFGKQFDDEILHDGKRPREMMEHLVADHEGDRSGPNRQVARVATVTEGLSGLAEDLLVVGAALQHIDRNVYRSTDRAQICLHDERPLATLGANFHKEEEGNPRRLKPGQL